MASVEIRNLNKSFGPQQVLRNINIDVADGEFVALVGPSGCGKSTLLRMIAGLEEVSGGDIAIDGAVINELAPKERDIAMVFQNYALYPHMTVYDNMAFSLQLKNVPKVSIEQKVRNAASILDITPYLERYPRQLSGGQRQRVAMGRAIVRDPRVFLFDEPLSNLDAKLRVNMRTEIKALHQRLHVTSIYVTHDQIEAMTMADRIVVLNGGRIEQVGPPLELYDRPANAFVASFIGSPAMNMMDGVLRIDGDGAHVRTADGTELPIDGQVDARNGQRVTYGVRPEHLAYCVEGGVACTVKLIEPTGSTTYIYGNIAGHSICAIFNERHAVAPGGVIRLQPKTNQIHLFDAESRNRIVVHRPERGKADTPNDGKPATRPMHPMAAEA